MSDSNNNLPPWAAGFKGSGSEGGDGSLSGKPFVIEPVSNSSNRKVCQLKGCENVTQMGWGAKNKDLCVKHNDALTEGKVFRCDQDSKICCFKKCLCWRVEGEFSTGFCGRGQGSSFVKKDDDGNFCECFLRRGGNCPKANHGTAGIQTQESQLTVSVVEVDRPEMTATNSSNSATSATGGKGGSSSSSATKSAFGAPSSSSAPWGKIAPAWPTSKKGKEEEQDLAPSKKHETKRNQDDANDEEDGEDPTPPKKKEEVPTSSVSASEEEDSSNNISKTSNSSTSGSGKLISKSGNSHSNNNSNSNNSNNNNNNPWANFSGLSGSPSHSKVGKRQGGFNNNNSNNSGGSNNSSSSSTSNSNSATSATSAGGAGGFGRGGFSGWGNSAAGAGGACSTCAESQALASYFQDALTKTQAEKDVEVGKLKTELKAAQDEISRLKKELEEQK